MAYLTLDPNLVQYLLEGEKDILSEPNQERLDRIQNTPCPRCGSALEPQLAQQPFTGHDPLPKVLARCSCGYTVDPDTKIVLDTGSAARVEDPLPIIRPED